LVALQKHKWLTVGLSVLLTGSLLLWGAWWLQKQREADDLVTAGLSLGLTELMIDETVAHLDELASAGVDSCEWPHLELLRRTAFASSIIKDLDVVGTYGQTLCTGLGGAFAGEVLASAATSNPDIMLDVVGLTETKERLLRVRRLAPRGMPGLAALLRTDLMLPRVTADGGRFAGIARMTLADGTVVATSGAGTAEAALPNANVVGRVRSVRYGPIVTVAAQADPAVANAKDLRVIALAFAILTIFAGLICLLMIPRRQRANPRSEIEKALIAGEFVPYYQPIIDIRSGRVLGAEVLVRWRKPDGTIIGPGAFIPLMESSGLVVDLTRALMRHACAEVGATIEARPEMYLGFNIAPRHFKDSVILNDVGSIFEGSPIRLSQVVLEVTERYELENLTATRRVIAALQALGCRIALDDVGTGHSGLSYILKLGVDIIKIDKLFVEAIKTEPHTQAIVNTLVDLARNMRMKIIAEGVEHFEQVVYLREHGISAVQGYVFAQPMPGPAFLQLVETVNARPAKGAGKALTGAAQPFAVGQNAAA
jgi:EAL domain-containing protein (putative c-di-GMP-specific phosphodiesterase class I)